LNFKSLSQRFVGSGLTGFTNGAKRPFGTMFSAVRLGRWLIFVDARVPISPLPQT
jgi:hypothetical protein